VALQACKHGVAILSRAREQAGFGLFQTPAEHAIIRDNKSVIWVRLLFSLPLLLLAAQPGYSSVKLIPAKLRPEASAAFDRYVAQAEARMTHDPTRDSRLRGGELRIESGSAGLDINVPGGMIQDWVGSMFLPGATLAQVQSVLWDYANYKNYYLPKVIESKQLARTGDDYDVFLRLHEEHVLTVVLNTTYHIVYRMPDPQHLSVTSRSTRIAEVKDPDNSYEDELPSGDDSGFLWRLNSYWHFAAADGGVYAQCEAISLSRDVPLAFGWMLKGFLESFPKESMVNTLRGTSAAVDSLKAAGSVL
jgi:hypothetical protein